jgi:hypothetical protein
LHPVSATAQTDRVKRRTSRLASFIQHLLRLVHIPA